MPICSTLHLHIAREWKYSTNIYWQWQPKTEASKDFKSDCNNGI